MRSLLGCCVFPVFLLLIFGGCVFLVDSDLNFLDHEDAYVDKKAPALKNASVLINGTVQSLSLSEYNGKKLMIIFSTTNMGRSLPEVLELQKRLHEFRELNVHLLLGFANTDSSHLQQTGAQRFGASSEEILRNVEIPLLIDPEYRISKLWGVSDGPHHGPYLSGFMIDSEGVVRRRIVGSLPLDRVVNELLKSRALDHEDQSD